MNWDPMHALTDHEEVVKDNEDNPEYEVHIGRLIASQGSIRNQRYVSVWVQGVRFSGYLTEEN